MERSSGVLLHPTSLPDSPICGSFGHPARKWLHSLAKNGIGVWQFLPLAPTDSMGSPYSSPSSFAFNPWFLDVSDLEKEDFLTNKSLMYIQDLGGCEDKVDFQLANLKVKRLLNCCPASLHIRFT